MERRKRKRIALDISGLKYNGALVSGDRGFTSPYEVDLRLDPTINPEEQREFSHIPGFKYSVSGEGKAWVEYTQQRDAKGASRGAKSTKKETSSPKAAVRAPDGGWGWVIVMASMGISLVADGISFSFGIIYVEFLRYFGESKSKTSVVGSLFMAVPLMAGPLASALVDRFGCRSMTILGGVISAAGFVASSMANSIEVLYFTFGVLSGLGLALCYVTAVVCVAFWFDSRRSLANGLGVCGTGLGTFVFAPMTQVLIENYGWRGTTLILAGAFLQMCVCGAVMRDPDKTEEDSALVLRDVKVDDGAHRRLLMDRQKTTSFINDRGLIQPNDGCKSRGLKYELMDKRKKTRSLGDLNGGGEKTDSLLQLPKSDLPPNTPADSSSSRTHIHQVENKSCSLSASNEILMYRDERDDYGLKDILSSPSGQYCPVNLVPDVHISMAVKKIPSESPKKLKAKAIGTSRKMSTVMSQQASSMAQLQGLRFRRTSVTYRGPCPIVNRHYPRASSCPDIYRMAWPYKTKESKERWYDDFLQLLNDMMDLSMFLEWHFMLLSISTFLLFTFFIVPYFYLAEHVISLGYSEPEASMLISVIGILNTVGMIALGWAGDQAWMNVTKVYALCLCLCGIFTGIMPLLTSSYPSLAVACALFGLFFGSNFSFTPVLIVELTSLDRFTMAYGLILLTQGLGNLLGPPLAGWLYDITKSWNISFYLAGFFIFISGLAISLITCTNNYILGRSNRRTRYEDEDINARGQNLLETG